MLATGKRYSNHFVSVITIRDRRITHWRSSLDPLAVLDALGADVPVREAN
ncbi:nuclear transport factor 2 family protein [Streptomyces sp. NBC_00448]